MTIYLKKEPIFLIKVFNDKKVKIHIFERGDKIFNKHFEQSFRQIGIISF